MADEFRPNLPAVQRFQFSLGTLLISVFYAAAIATVTVNLAGRFWNPYQIAAAYIVTLAFVVGFAVLSRARGSIAAHLLLAPLVFVTAVSAAAMFKSAPPTVQPAATIVICPGPAPISRASSTTIPNVSLKKIEALPDKGLPVP